MSTEPFDAEQSPQTAHEVTRAAVALRDAWISSEAPGEELRARTEAALAALRALFRTSPRLFGADALIALREVSERLRPPAPVRKVGPPPGAPSPSQVLESVFGYADFRTGQREIIEAVLEGRDCVGIMPTGAGKSITYQIPARILGGTTLVVSPLIALMKDQVDAMLEVGLRATFLNSSLSPEVHRERVAALGRGEYELVYAAPEGLEASVGRVLRNVDLRLIAVDEAHCISHWGHDFRPAYRNLAHLKKRFGDVPVLALTATATETVTNDIVAQLGMTTPVVHRGTFFRPNLHLHAFKKGSEGRPPVGDSIVAFARAHQGDSGIVYCSSRKAVEALAERLTRSGLRAAAYHAGLESRERDRAQNAFREDEVDIVCATVAFGMGIDKSNVRYVIHRDMPRSTEGYYQEIGRAGRDGLPSECVLFYSWADVISLRRMTSDIEDPVVQARQDALAEQMFRFAERAQCRHRALASYFGETIDDCQTSCDVCLRSDLLGTLRPARKPGGRRKGDVDNTADAATMDLASELGTDSDLFVRLRDLRRRIAKDKRMPAYIVFSDATLVEMARRRPADEASLRAIGGVGPKKLAEYGARFLEEIGRSR